MKNSRFILAMALLAMALVGTAYFKSGRKVPSDASSSQQPSAMPNATSSIAASKPSVASLVAAMPTNLTPTVRGTLPYVLTSVEPFNSSLRIAVESQGAKTVGVLSRHSLLIEANDDTRARLASDGRFDEITELTPSGKVQPELMALINGGAKSVDVSLVALAAEDREIVISCLQQGGGEMLTGCINEGDVIRAKLPSVLVADLVGRGDVRWMEKFERPHLMNNLAVNAESMNVREVWDTHGLNGTNQVISTSDSGIDTGVIETMHADLRNRVKGIEFVDGSYEFDNSGHGTHTAGSIVGDGTLSTNQIRGVAYGADLYAWFCGGMGNSILLPEALSQLFVNNGAWNAFIHSASWGSSVSGQYDSRCVIFDDYLWENPEFLPVVSAGNDGYYGDCTVGSPAAAKNVLAVGATQSSRKGYDGGWGNGDPKAMAIFSSRGPCKDGRIKPDISAPGVGVLSTCSRYGSYSYEHSNTNYAYDSGTSMSCPLTAGAVAIVRQWLVEQKGFKDEPGVRPTAALMKAVIMGGAKDASTPNKEMGWGRVDLAATLFPTNGRAVKLIDRIPFAQDFTTNIVIETTNAAPLDVQLVWVDAPGSPNALQSTPKLVNDLDLKVEEPVSGEPLITYYGNGGDQPDTLNNAESVHIIQARPCTYVITVDCRDIMYPYINEKGEIRGAAALYIRGAFDPEATPDEPEYVRLKKLNRTFMSLDRALSAIEDDDETVEILRTVSLDKSVVLSKSCTIVATNDHPVADMVVRQHDAALTVTNGATVALSNIVFATSQATLLTVEEGGRVKLLDGVDLGVGYDDGVAIETADANGFELAGELTESLLLRCRKSKQLGDAFGTYSCADVVATNNAPKIACVDDVDRETRGYPAENHTLVWRHVNVPLEQAVAYYVSNDGTTNTFARMAKAMENFEKGYDAGTTSEFIVRANGDFDARFDVKRPLTIRGEGVVVPALKLKSIDSGFDIVKDGSLVISNVTFAGIKPTDKQATKEMRFIKVDGGELTLDDGASLNGIFGRVDRGSGVIDLKSGAVTMRDGASIINCSARGLSSGTGFGGAIYAKGKGCQLNLWGGVITNCFASSAGGGVYMCGYQDATEINVNGNLTIASNRSNGFADDDIYLLTSGGRAGFKVTGAMKGQVGVRYAATIGSGNNEGDSFITNAIKGEVDETTLRSFFSDALGNGYIAAVGTGDKAGTLVWAKDTRDKRQCDAANASARLIAGDKITYWWDVSDALNEATDTCIVEVLKDYTLTNNVSIGNGCVTLRTDMAKESGLTLTRAKNAEISIPGGSTLSITNLAFDGNRRVGVSSTPLFSVDGGTLKIDDVSIYDISGITNRNANAITVSKDGKFEMHNSQIKDCWNCSRDPSGAKDKIANAGSGGGLLVESSTAYLMDGVITGCKATKGGGVFACNGSTVYVGGGLCITNNTDLDHNANNLKLSQDSSQKLNRALTGKVGMTPGYLAVDTNLVAAVNYDWTSDIVALTNSAVRFRNDVINDVGVAVTNGTKALIVWSGAVRAQGCVYTNVADGVIYVLAGELPVLEKEPEDPPAPTPSRYQQKFGTSTDFTDEPVVEITKVENIEGGLEVTVLVKDGDTPVKVTPSEVAKLFQATSDVGDWTKTVEITVSDGESNSDNSVTYKVTPKDSASATFIRLVY